MNSRDVTSKPESAQSAVVLLSAGLDSSVNLYLAHQAVEIKLALTFDYGQRAARKEIAASKELCAQLNVPHEVVDLSFFKEFTHSSLVNQTLEVPNGDEIDLAENQASRSSATRVWVPNRNGIFLNIAAGFAEGLGADMVIPGFNLEEAQTFPDNSVDFIAAIDRSFAFSTANGVRVICYTVRMDKTEIVATGLRLGVPFQHLWPCYIALERPCGSCESCQRFARALLANGRADLVHSLLQKRP